MEKVDTKDSQNEEMNSLEKNRAWKLPKKQRIVGCK